MSLITFRDSLLNLAPRWLQGHWASRLLYAIGVHADALGDTAVAGVKARFPDPAFPEALAVIGRDRRMVRGWEESNEGFAARLVHWRPDLARKASPYALMNQLAGLLSPHKLPIRVVNSSGAWFTREKDGTASYREAPWNWDGTSSWARYWVILYPPPELWRSDGTWSDPGTWADIADDGSPYTYGSNATVRQAETVRQIVAEWGKPWWCENIIVSFDEDEFNPADTPAPTPLPDGHWQLWGHRAETCCYWDGC